MRGSEGARSMTEPVTIERLERAIGTVAKVMVKHDMPLGPTIRFLEAERERLLQRTADMDYAMEILRKQEAA
jgi:hypothetical protein